MSSAADPSLAPVGVFDSGVGGLTVLAAIRQRLPGLPLIYLGDTARLPYGTKSPATVRRYTERNLAFLIERGVQAVVVACNSASALALDDLVFDVPVWGVLEPGAKRAAGMARARVGIIATEATVCSGAYDRAIRRHRADLEILSAACPLFVPLVEEDWIEDPVTMQVARRYLEPLLAARVDTLVLGCTHYPPLKPVLADLCGPDVTLVDSAASVTDLVAAEVGPQVFASRASAGELQLFVTDASPRFARIAARLLQARVSLELVDV